MKNINFAVLLGTEKSSKGFYWALCVEKNETLNSVKLKKRSCFKVKTHRRRTLLRFQVTDYCSHAVNLETFHVLGRKGNRHNTLLTHISQKNPFSCSYVLHAESKLITAHYSYSATGGTQ